jgi:hypothetical protein
MGWVSPHVSYFLQPAHKHTGFHTKCLHKQVQSSSVGRINLISLLFGLFRGIYVMADEAVSDVGSGDCFRAAALDSLPPPHGDDWLLYLTRAFVVKSSEREFPHE